jgi:membrane-bound serine protease (ClpP class)
LSAAFFIWVIGRFVRLRHQRVRTGGEEMLGSLGVAVDGFEGPGRVRVHSEDWRALAPRPVRKGQPVRVIGVDGLTLTVEPIEEDD